MLPPPDPAGYRQIADDLRQQIRSGVLSPGQRMMSIADLAHTYGVAIGTAERAIQVLRTEGLVVSDRGKRSRVAQPPDRQTVTLFLGDDLVMRPPTADEARIYSIGAGVWVLEVTGPGKDGRPQRTVYPGDRFRFVVKIRRSAR